MESPISDRRFCTYSIKHIYHTISTDILDKIVWKVSSTEITRLEIEVLYIHLTNEIDQHTFFVNNQFYCVQCFFIERIKVTKYCSVQINTILQGV